MKRQLTTCLIISLPLGVSKGACPLGRSLLAVLAICIGLSLAMPAFAAAAATQNKDAVAVIIGNKDYAGSVPDVDFAHNDAEAMKRFVVEVLGFREGNIIDLRDATQAQMISAFGNERSHEGKLWQYLRQGRSDVMVFYSGHGVPGQKDGRGYMLPVDADPDTPELNGYPLDLLYENLRKLGARSVAIFIDACFSGDSARGMLINSASPIGLSAVPERAGANLTILTAAHGKQLASWDDEAKHGLFTRYLLEGLYGQADSAPLGDGDGSVTVAEVSAYLEENMTYAARRSYGRVQHATVHGDDAIVLVSVPEGGAVKPPIIAPSEPAVALPIIVSLDQQMSAVRNANVRTGPGTSHDRLLTLSSGAEVSVTGRSEDGEWYRIALAGGRIGYVFKNLLKEKRAGLSVGDSFRDCPECPEMVVVPAGSFMMGSPESEEDRDDDEGPVHRVSVRQPFAIGKYEVTFAEWDACVAGGGCNGYRPKGGGGGKHPVEGVSYKNAKAYTAWLSRKTGHAYRLPSEAEWEYAARAGTTTRFYFGNSISSAQANYASNLGETIAVGSYLPNSFGLHDVHGNVHEWVEGCWNKSYAGAPSDTNVWTAGDCSLRVLRGGSWNNDRPRSVRSASRKMASTWYWDDDFGFRIARSLP